MQTQTYSQKRDIVSDDGGMFLMSTSMKIIIDSRTVLARLTWSNTFRYFIYVFTKTYLYRVKHAENHGFTMLSYDNNNNIDNK